MEDFELRYGKMDSNAKINIVNSVLPIAALDGRFLGQVWSDADHMLLAASRREPRLV